MARKIEISHRTIIFTFAFIALIWFLVQIKDILILLFVALLIMVILNPLVRKLARYKIPRALSVLAIYLICFAILIISLGTIVPALVDQTSNFVANFPNFISNLHLSPQISNQVSAQISILVGDLPSRLIDFGVGIVSNIFVIFTVLTFAFYLLMARNKIDGKFSRFFNEKWSHELENFLDEIEKRLGGWARGQIILMFTVGFFSFFGLTILAIPYALPLGIFAGLMEVVPYIGPILGAAPAVVIGFGTAPVTGIAVTALAFLIQQVENYVLAPKVIEKSVGVPPIITLLALTIGFRLDGVVGVLISIPLVITVQVLLEKYFIKK